MKTFRSLFVNNFWVIPIVYMVVAVFLLRSNVWYVYLAALTLVALASIAQYYSSKVKPEVKLARWIAVLAAIGISVSFILSIEKIELLSEPAHIASCSLSPIVSCSPVIESWQASAFGMPNSFIGILGFACVFAAAMTIAAGASKLSKNWWRTLLGGLLFAAGFSMWLMYQGVFEINKLCLYCMLVWLTTTALLWIVLAYCVRNRYIHLSAVLEKVFIRSTELIMVTYLVIFLVLALKWFDYWASLFRY